MPETFVCASCRRTFTKDAPDSETWERAQARDDTPEPESAALVCSGCFLMGAGADASRVYEQEFS